ncbi:hypothetical protein CORC01_08301 [Colletotrichum orchidophilum]|uniref:Uncharacterized protein n=1 Tax=Colletotrichum orchidophilum TaxID=1209926 RepID=A0A1G4B4K9_9PEZI|nr:hypothetical protein CORC01_08301 [Colletotrichum orchidophilum]
MSVFRGRRYAGGVGDGRTRTGL